jgi:predicted CoA-binding protein
MRGRRLETDGEIRDALLAAKTVAVVGLSPRPERDSHRVAAYLQASGYRIVPIHPAADTILGETARARVIDAPPSERPDLVDVFRRPDALPALVSELPEGEGRTLWLQVGVTHPEAEEAALAAGWNLVVDRCALVEHRRLVGT